MVNKILVFVLLVLIQSCDNSKIKKPLARIKKIEIQSKQISKEYVPDIQLNNKLRLIDQINDLNTISLNDFCFIQNLKKDEVLVMSISFGGSKNEYRFFDIISLSNGQQNELKKYNVDLLKIPTINIISFKSESGIKLGMSRDEIHKIKGDNCEIIKKGDEVEIHKYVIDNQNSKFLQKYNLPKYVAHFFFQNNKLCRYSFGFEMP